MSASKDKDYSDKEIAKRRDQALLRALSMPPKHHNESSKKKGAAKRPKSK